MELLQHLCLQYLWNHNDIMNDELRLSYVFLSLYVHDVSAGMTTVETWETVLALVFYLQHGVAT